MSIEGVDATEAAVVAAMLASDNVPDENQSANCLSCGAAMKGLHCVDCGQKNDNYRRSIFSLFADLFGSIFSLESRIWRTWGTLLFKPGKVPREFADGRRMHWSSPVRVYLAMSIILFGFMSVTGTHLFSLDVDVQKKAEVEKPIDQLTRQDLQINWGSHFFETQRQIDARNEDRDFDLIARWFELNMAENSEQVAEALGTMEENVQNSLEEEGLQTDVEIPDWGIASGTDDDGGFYLQIGGQQYEAGQAGQVITGFIQNPAALTNSFNKWLPRLMFIMMPFTMLFGALFIRDKEKGLLFDHLVHAAYIHAVAFFLLFAGILLSKVIPGGFVFQAIFIGLLIFLPLSLKRMFGRGWFKTFFTTYTVGFIYLIVMMISLTGLITWELSKTVGV